MKDLTFTKFEFHQGNNRQNVYFAKFIPFLNNFQHRDRNKVRCNCYRFAGQTTNKPVIPAVAMNNLSRYSRVFQFINLQLVTDLHRISRRCCCTNDHGIINVLPIIVSYSRWAIPNYAGRQSSGYDVI